MSLPLVWCVLKNKREEAPMTTTTTTSNACVMGLCSDRYTWLGVLSLQKVQQLLLSIMLVHFCLLHQLVLHWMDACRGLVERSSLDEIQ
jgi:hypothetical protein